MTDEYALIEIAKRFRKLEDVIEEADLFLSARAESMKETIDSLEAKHAAGKISYNAWCRLTAQPNSELDNLRQVRVDVEKWIDICRDDMVNMQDELRKVMA
jgi:hypothetical protein